MVLRQDGEGVTAISQAAHAWISGQLAVHWGNKQFGEFAPREEVCLAAEQHDIGFLEWEHAPTMDPKTGLPHSFMVMPLDVHLQIWTRSVRDMMAFSRYATWLVSLHVASLCQRHLNHAAASEIPALQQFLERQRRIQTALKNSLAQDSTYGPLSHDHVIRRNQRLVATWDWMSLVFLQGFSGSHPVEEVPGAGGMETLLLRSQAGGPATFQVTPWPFQTGAVALTCDGKRLSHSYPGETAMRKALEEAPSTAVCIRLVP